MVRSGFYKIVQAAGSLRRNRDEGCWSQEDRIASDMDAHEKCSGVKLRDIQQARDGGRGF